jgi:hypothetical protein
MPDVPVSVKLYRCLLKLYPAAFREDYADPMEQEVRDEFREVTGFRAVARLWVRLLTDLATSIPLQIMREISLDAGHAIRLWTKRPVEASFAILALAIGIGATVGVFSVVNALMLQSLPFLDPSRLATLEHFLPPDNSAKEFHEWAAQRAYLADTAVYEQRFARRPKSPL